MYFRFSFVNSPGTDIFVYNDNIKIMKCVRGKRVYSVDFQYVIVLNTQKTLCLSCFLVCVCVFVDDSVC